MTLDEARKAYMKMLKDDEELSSEAKYLARESFTEGWIACERNLFGCSNTNAGFNPKDGTSSNG